MLFSTVTHSILKEMYLLMNLQTMPRPHTQISCCKTMVSQEKAPSVKSAQRSQKKFSKLLIGFFSSSVSKAYFNHLTNLSNTPQEKGEVFKCKSCSTKRTQYNLHILPVPFPTPTLQVGLVRCIPLS